MALGRWDGSFISSNQCSLMYNDIKTEIRNLKLKIISGDFEIYFSDVNKKRHREELNFILKNFKESDVITGSLALKLYGLLDRQINDIDIIIEDEDRYTHYYSGSYNDFRIESRLGYKTFKERGWLPFSKKEYEVDFFKNVGVTFHEMDFNGKKIKIHNPIDIINLKSEMFLDSRNHKHYNDLFHIFNSINLVY